MRLILFAICLATSTALAAPVCQIPGLPNIKGKSYHVARGLLIEAGFRPVLSYKTDTDAPPFIYEPRTLFGYAEVSACALTGYGGCTYRWMTKTQSPFTVYARESAGEVRSCSLGY